MALSEHSTRACVPEAELRRFHAQEVLPDERSAIQQHLDECPACAARAAGLLREHDTWVQRIQAVGAPPPERPAPRPREVNVTTLEIPGYELFAEVRRGGQGIVFRALQKSTKREVALKILREGRFASDAARRRFEREIELVATLRHPHIVTAFDSGETSDGHQYFVMDFVQGQSLGHHISAHNPPLTAQLALFSEVCQAVNYAHQRGVIHRDLKPSNILVDEEGHPHILDFGLARHVAATEGTQMTITGHVAGTLPYMSPEQARGLPDAVDVRSDVYALGVILYELLTGAYPYPVEGDTIKVLQHIAETPPTRPSRARARPAGESAGCAPRVRARIGDELDTIVLRALAKEREQRYQSAGALARDLDHFLAGEPIEAKRDGAYLLRKMLYRYRAAVVVAAAFVVLLTASALALAVMYAQQTRLRVEAERQAEIARAAETKASQRFEQVRSIAEAFIFELDPTIRHLPGSAPARQWLVKHGLAYLDALAPEVADDPEFERRMAGAYMTVGDVQGDLAMSNLGDLRGALDSYRKAQQILEHVAARQPGNVITERTIVLNLLKIGDIHVGLGATEVGLATYRLAADLGEEVHTRAPQDAFVRANLCNAYSRLSGELQNQGDLEGALGYIRKSMELLERSLAQDPKNPGLIQMRAADAARLGQIHYLQGRLDQALQSYRQCLDFSEQFCTAMPEHIYGRRCVAISHQWLGIIHAELGDHQAAVADLGRALGTIEELLREDTQNELLRQDHAETCLELGESQLALGEHDLAARSYRLARESIEPLAEQRAKRPDILRAQARAYQRSAELDVARAHAPDCPRAEQTRCLESARTWLERGNAVCTDMKQRQLLTPADAELPEQIAVLLTACTAELERLSQSDPAGRGDSP